MRTMTQRMTWVRWTSYVATALAIGSISNVAACSEAPKAAAPDIQAHIGSPLRAGQTPAFPGALGYGAAATGGRGGAVLHVTTLADSGPGSLRAALMRKGPRIVIFDLSGAIRLQSQILIENGDLTLAGQTAPGEGITIEGSRVRVKAGNIIIRGMHFRPGDGPGMDPGDRDGMMIGTTGSALENIIVDRNSFTWAIDENLTVNGNVHNVTLSNNIIAEGLSHSLHPKGEHSKGLLVSNWSGEVPVMDGNISILRNLLASNTQRNPEVRAGQNIEIINNLSYNYIFGHGAIWIGGGSKGSLRTTVNLIGNVIKPGPNSPQKKPPIAIAEMAAGSRIFLKDNLWTKRTDSDQDSLYSDAGGGRYLVRNTDFGSGVPVLDSGTVVAHVLAHAGTSSYSGNSVDARILRYVAAGGGRIINNTSEAGGMPSARITPQKAAPDSDGDGMPDWFEDRYGFDKTVNDANGDSDKDGFTNIEEYINGIITGFDLPAKGRS